MPPRHHPVLLGTSGWSYDDWQGPFYPEGLRPDEYLSYYADRFEIVEVDSTFYRVPDPATVRGWDRKTPEPFRFALKVPRAITHEKRLRDCEADVSAFVKAVRPLGKKLAAGLLQFGYFNRATFSTLDDFLAALDPFLAAWPRDEVPLAVEVRNPRWVGPELVEVLRDHQAALTLTEQTWMPRPSQVVEQLDVLTGPFSFVRLLGDRDEIERLTTTWDRVVLDRDEELAQTAGVIDTLRRRAPVFAFVNNHYAGHSPATVAQLRGLLGLPAPTPPPRARTTLFD